MVLAAPSEGSFQGLGASHNRIDCEIVSLEIIVLPLRMVVRNCDRAAWLDVEIGVPGKASLVGEGCQSVFQDAFVARDRGRSVNLSNQYCIRRYS